MLSENIMKDKGEAPQIHGVSRSYIVLSSEEYYGTDGAILTRHGRPRHQRRNEEMGDAISEVDVFGDPPLLTLSLHTILYLHLVWR